MAVLCGRGAEFHRWFDAKLAGMFDGIDGPAIGTRWQAEIDTDTVAQLALGLRQSEFIGCAAVFQNLYLGQVVGVPRPGVIEGGKEVRRALVPWHLIRLWKRDDLRRSAADRQRPVNGFWNLVDDL